MQVALLHAVDFQAQDESGMDRIAGLLRFVHGINRGTPEPLLGIDFPDWVLGRPETSVNALSRVRVLSENSVLQMFLAHPGVRRAAATGLARSAIVACPVVEAWASVTRDNRADKAKPSYRRRAAARNEGRELKVVRQAALSIPFASQATRQDFELRVKKSSLLQVPTEVHFNAYGLCKLGGLPQY